MENKNQFKSQVFFTPIFFGQLVERFSYWGIQAILVLYLVNKVGLTHRNAYLIYGTFTALTFSISIFGGLLADFFFSYFELLILGIVLLVFGYGLGVFESSHYLIMMTFILAGTGIFSSNSTNFFGQCISINNPKRSKGFNLLYMATNAGGLFGPILYGLIVGQSHWKFAYIFSAFLSLAWLFYIIYIVKNNKDKLPQRNSRFFIKTVPRIYLIIFFSISTILFVDYLLNHVDLTKIFLITISLLFFVYFLYFFLKENSKMKIKLIYLILLMVFIGLFFSVELQVNSSLLILISKYIQRNIFGYQVPVPIFAGLEPLGVIVFSIFLGNLWHALKKKNIEPHTIVKVSLGFFMCSIAFLIFGFIACYANILNYSVLLLLLSGNLILGLADTMISPSIIDAVNGVAPKNMKGFMVGGISLAIGIGGYFSGQIAAAMSKSKELVPTYLIAHQVYNKIAELLLFFSIVLMIVFFSKPLKNFVKILK